MLHGVDEMGRKGASGGNNKATGQYSLKRIAFQFPPSSPIRVYFHGMYQKSRGRGRQPTLTFGNHTDPREAFKAAKELVGDYVEQVRRQTNSRHWTWDYEVVEAMMAGRPAEEIGQLAKVGELSKFTYQWANGLLETEYRPENWWSLE